jgi:hypothetical protein
MEALGFLSRAGWEGGSGKIARVGWRVGLGTITKAHLIVDLEMWADRVRRSYWVLYPGPCGRADRGKWPGCVGGQNQELYLRLFGKADFDCGRNAYEGGIGYSTLGLV